MAVPPELSDVPAKLDTDCRDPGLPPINTVDDAVKAIGATRIYAACERAKHRDMKTFYRNVRAKLGNR